MAKSKRPTDINQRAKSIVDIATGEKEDNLKEKDLIKLAAGHVLKKVDGKEEGDTNNSENHTSLEIPKAYDKDLLTWEQRCIYILQMEAGLIKRIMTIEDIVRLAD